VKVETISLLSTRTKEETDSQGYKLIMKCRISGSEPMRGILESGNGPKPTSCEIVNVISLMTERKSPLLNSFLSFPIKVGGVGLFFELNFQVKE